MKINDSIILLLVFSISKVFYILEENIVGIIFSLLTIGLAINFMIELSKRKTKDLVNSSKDGEKDK